MKDVEKIQSRAVALLIVCLMMFGPIMAVAALGTALSPEIRVNDAVGCRMASARAGSVGVVAQGTGTGWEEVYPAISPGARFCAPIVYDIESDRMVVFSGWQDLSYAGPRYNDTWSYDTNTNTWTNMSPAVMPTGRGGHAMAYHEAEDVIVMFGGSTGSQRHCGILYGLRSSGRRIPANDNPHRRRCSDCCRRSSSSRLSTEEIIQPSFKATWEGGSRRS